ncbi:glutaredoxin domain-containing protein [Streptomyces sp. NRRL F-5727]|uniref:glutaredoxin domain-containing protein n=1 Tax=Streptomyces sp. NRRL F-5727 TaxID=1463871 RepID=UPI00056B1B59|nr:glutaredoxin domain-containing protein [Streptomyces sp. NRRL F-5727]
MIRAWTPPAMFALVGVLLAAASFARGDSGTGAVLLVLFLALAGANSPLVFPRSLTSAEAVRRSAADGRPVVYWRPGCQYCVRLRVRLGRRARRAHWVNIWRDPEAAAAVRAVNDGNETVPTVLLAGRPHTNPDPAWLRDRIDGLSPPRDPGGPAR